MSKSLGKCGRSVCSRRCCMVWMLYDSICVVKLPADDGDFDMERFERVVYNTELELSSGTV